MWKNIYAQATSKQTAIHGPHWHYVESNLKVVDMGTHENLMTTLALQKCKRHTYVAKLWCMILS